jgi:tRNA dimethylallyltransferase
VKSVRDAEPYLAIVGATGTGKSDLAVDVAVALAERGIPHHLIDVLEVTDEATVAWYQPRAREAIDGIRSRGALPILVGGSGLYVSSVLYEFAFPGRDAEVRARLEAEAQQRGVAVLLERLRVLDPKSAANVDPANPRRVIRALEVAELRESGHGATLPERPELWSPAVVVGLGVPREKLVGRLDARVERMWARGLLEEVRGLLDHGLERGVTASRAIGYAQAVAQLRGDLTRDAAIAETQRLTRRYARRQVSWFKRYPDLQWLDPGEERGHATRAVLDRLPG